MRWLCLTAGVIVVACTGVPAGDDDVPIATRLPIEVIGAPGVAVEATIEVAAVIARARDVGLELVVSNVVAVESAFVAINDGVPIDLGATQLRRASGGTGTAVIALPAGAVRAGTNRLVFSYAKQVPDVSGFRVLAAAIVAGARAELALPDDDPAAWQAPSPETIADGERYFRAEARDGGPTCATCHVDDGADLTYFAFSNHSIIARAEHHRFSPDEASAIASYLRSLPVAPTGRVFDSPFQPGPNNRGAAGSGHAALADVTIALPDEIAWDFALSIDPYKQPLPFETPTWLRWLPRRIDPAWFTRDDGLLRAAETALVERGTLVEARAFMSAAIRIGKEVLIADGDHGGRVELLRYAAVKLWDWQRQHGGFDGADHGFPAAGPPFPYEVGFAFFEAANAGAVPDAMGQTMQWWVAQAALNPGRGMTSGARPLDWGDVLRVAEDNNGSALLLVLLHLRGSWEESQGALADDFGTERGPVRLLAVPLRHADGATAFKILRRFLARERAFVDAGGTLAPGHHTLLRTAWESRCASLSASDRDAVRTVAPAAVSADLVACP